jgi:hypothetical protein
VGVEVSELQNAIVGIAGRKGSGKSTMARRILERCPRVFVFDPIGEHTWLPNRFSDLGEAEECLAWGATQRTFAGSYIPDRMDAGDFEYLCDAIYDYGNLILAIEEVPMLCGPSYLPEGFDRLVRLGRHRRLNVLWSGQRMVEVARRLTAATDLFILFSHTEPRDLDAIAERCGRDVAERVARLGLHDYLAWDAVARAEADLEDVVSAVRK